MSEARSVALNLSSKELVFLQKVTRQEYHFITEDEQQARLKLRDKLLEGFFDQQQNRIVLNLNRDELAKMGIALKDSKDPKTGEIVTTWEVAR